MTEGRLPRHIVFDWGDTLMPDDPGRKVPMCLWPTVSVFPDVVQALPRLAGHCVLSIATNAEHSDEDMIRRALARVAIESYFAHVFCFRRVGVKKSDPAFWAFLIRTLGASAEDVWMIGDDFDGDIAPASRFGIYSIWLNRRTPEHRSGPRIHTVRDLNEVMALLSTSRLETW